MNSSGQKRSSTLAWVTPERALNFLERLANLRPDTRSFLTFEKHYGRFLEGFGHPIGPRDQLTSEEQQFARNLRQSQVAFLQLTLQQLWRAESLREKEFRAFELRNRVLQSVQQYLARKRLGIQLKDAIERNILAYDSQSEMLPPPHPFEDVVRWLERWLLKTRYCANPKCVDPYFIGIRKTQKYCSAECSKPSQSEFKRLWWRKYGRKWRREHGNPQTQKKGRRKS